MDGSLRDILWTLRRWRSFLIPAVLWILVLGLLVLILPTSSVIDKIIQNDEELEKNAMKPNSSLSPRLFPLSLNPPRPMLPLLLLR